jgi:hypothetical protein
MLPSKNPRVPKIVFCDEAEHSSTQTPLPTRAMREERLRQSIERHVQKEFHSANCVEVISSIFKQAGIVVGVEKVWHLGAGGQWELWSFDELERFAIEALVNCDHTTTTAVTSTKSKILNYFNGPASTECDEAFKAWLMNTVDEIVQSHVNSLVLSAEFSAMIRLAHGTMDLDWFQRRNASDVDHFVCAKQLYKVVDLGYVPVISRILQLQSHQTQSLLSTALDGDNPIADIPQELSPINADVLLALQISLGSALLGNRIQSNTLIQLSGPGATGVFRSIQMLAGSYGWAPRLQSLANASNSLRSSFQRLTFFDVAKSDCSTLKRALNNVRSIGAASSTLVLVLTATDLTPIPIDAFRVLSVTIGLQSTTLPTSSQTPSQLSAGSSRYLAWLAAGVSHWASLPALVIDHFVCGSKLGERAIKHVIESFAAKSNWLASKPAEGKGSVTRNQVTLKDIVDPIRTLASQLGYKSLVITQREIANGLESLAFDTSKTGNRLCVWYYTSD